MEIKIPAPAEEILTKLNENGYEAYVVGGCVRDMILGREPLTIEDIDLYSMVSRRIAHEDVYSIIETCFMPCGVECDQYSVIGGITAVDLNKNRITGEEIYNLTLDCNDMVFHVIINKQDLLGEPKTGRRFKGQVWMQGTLKFEA